LQRKATDPSSRIAAAVVDKKLKALWEEHMDAGLRVALDLD